MKKDLIFEKRKKAKKLYEKGYSIRKIAKCIVANKTRVSTWVKMPDEDLLKDNRGWQKGKLRIHTEKERDRIIEIRKQLKEEECYFIGAKVVVANYQKRHKKEITESFVDRVLNQEGLVSQREKKMKGRSKYMCYPTHTLSKLGKILMGIDFIGPKYIEKGRERINFLSCKYIRPMQWGMTKKIKGQTTEEAIQTLLGLWKEHPMPDVIKMDNDAAFGLSGVQKGSVGRFTLFLLNVGISPLYIAPRSPWNNGETEGHNSVFSKKFWSKIRFHKEEEIDVKIEKFNIEYKKYSNLICNDPEIKKPRYIDDYKDIDLENKNIYKFKKSKIYFLRVVRRKGDKGEKNEKGFINIMGRDMMMPRSYINLYTFCIIDLKKERVSINVEEENGKLLEVKYFLFKI